MADILKDILAEIIIALVIPVASLAYYRARFYPRRRALWRFFNLSKDCKIMVVYLSSIVVPQRCAQNYRGEIRSYTGITIPGEEFQIIQWVNECSRILRIDLYPGLYSAGWSEKVGTWLRLSYIARALCGNKRLRRAKQRP